MLRATLAVILFLLVPAANLTADQLTLRFEGIVTEVVDESVYGEPPVDFQPIPVGSSFFGTLYYDTVSPVTYGGTGYATYVDLLSSGGSLTINGHTILTSRPHALSAGVISQEANFSSTGVNIGNQALLLPKGWIPDEPNYPYYTVQFFDAVPQTRSLALPSSQAEFSADDPHLILDFVQPVTVNGVTYGGRVYIVGEITSFEVGDPVPPPLEVNIDVLPKDPHNSVNWSDKNPQPLEVVVFGASNLDVRAIVPASIALGDPILTNVYTGDGRKIAPDRIQYADINHDHKTDAVLKFSIKDLKRTYGIDTTSTSLELVAVLDDEQMIYGTDPVSIQGIKHKGK